MQVEIKHWDWLKKSLNNQNEDPELFAFAKVWYFVPALSLGEENIRKSTTAAFYWDALYETWKTADYDMAVLLEQYLSRIDDFPE